MTRRHSRETRRFHCLLYADDLDFLEGRFGINGDRPIGTGTAIREIVNKRVREMKARIQAAVDEAGASAEAADGG